MQILKGLSNYHRTVYELLKIYINFIYIYACVVIFVLLIEVNISGVFMVLFRIWRWCYRILFLQQLFQTHYCHLLCYPLYHLAISTL